MVIQLTQGEEDLMVQKIPMLATIFLLLLLILAYMITEHPRDKKEKNKIDLET